MHKKKNESLIDLNKVHESILQVGRNFVPSLRERKYRNSIDKGYFTGKDYGLADLAVSDTHGPDKGWKRIDCEDTFGSRLKKVHSCLTGIISNLCGSGLRANSIIAERYRIVATYGPMIYNESPEVCVGKMWCGDVKKPVFNKDTMYDPYLDDKIIGDVRVRFLDQCCRINEERKATIDKEFKESLERARLMYEREFGDSVVAEAAKD